MAKAPVAFLIHGFIGAGKTTFAKQLEKQENALRFTHDEWVSRLYGADPPAERFEAYAGRVSEVMEDTWTRCLALGLNVVLDTGFWTYAERARVRELVKAAGGEPALYSLRCPEALAWKRIEQRNRNVGDGLFIAPNTFQLLKKRFQPLHPDEEHVEVVFDR